MGFGGSGRAQNTEKLFFQNFPENNFVSYLEPTGAVFQWHPELNIGFAYVPTLLNWIDLVNNKARLLQGEVLACALRNKNKT